MKEDLFTKEELQELAPVFKSKRGSALLDRLVHFVALDRLNAGYRESSIYEGVDCAHELLKIFETEYFPKGPSSLSATTLMVGWTDWY